MQPRTKRRALLGGLAVGGLGGLGYLLRPAERTRWGRWLHPADSIADSDTFAYVGRIAHDGQTMTVQVAMRETAYEAREITLFANSGQSVTATIPGLRGFWRFDVSMLGRKPGPYTLDVASETLDVTLDRTIPPRFRNPRLRLTPRGVWRSNYFAHAHAYDTGPETGRMHVAFRQRNESLPVPLDTLEFRTPDGDVIGRSTVPDGVYGIEFDIEPFYSFEGTWNLVGLHDGETVDEIELFHF